MSPEAIVDTTSLGTPTGSARMAAVAIAVLPEPPAASTPWQRPSSNSRRTTTGAAAHIACDGRAAVGQRGEVEPARGGHLLARHVGRRARRPLRADVDQEGGDPACCSRSRRNAYSSPLVSSVPTRTTVGGLTGSPHCRVQGFAGAGAVRRAGAANSARHSLT